MTPTLQDRLAAVLTAMVEIILADVAAARLALIDVAAVGQGGLVRRHALSVGLQDVLRQAATVDGRRGHVGGRADGAGRRDAADLRRPPARRPAAAAAAGRAGSRGVGRDVRDRAPRRLAAPNPLLMASSVPDDAPTTARAAAWPPRTAAGLRAPQPAHRILDAVLAVSAQQGFEAASIRELFAAAGLSPEAFYEHFATKEDAWATAFDQAFVALFGAAWHAALPHRDRPAKVSAAVGAALGLLASEPGYARLLLVDAPSAGRAGQPALDDALQAFARLLTRATAGPAESSPSSCRWRWPPASPSWPPAGSSTAAPRSSPRCRRRWSS